MCRKGVVGRFGGSLLRTRCRVPENLLHLGLLSVWVLKHPPEPLTLNPKPYGNLNLTQFTHGALEGAWKWT